MIHIKNRRNILRNILFCLLALVLFSCSNSNVCNNRITFLKGADEIPYLDFKHSGDFDSLRLKIEELNGFESCEVCDYIPFNITQTIYGKKINVTVFINNESPYCENCPVYSRERNEWCLDVNKDNRLLFEGEPIKNLTKAINDCLEKVETGHENYPEHFEQVKYRFDWDKSISKDVFDSLLNVICVAHVEFVEKTINKQGQLFCEFDKKMVDSVRKEFPLKIEFDLGRRAAESEEIEKSLSEMLFARDSLKKIVSLYTNKKREFSVCDDDSLKLYSYLSDLFSFEDIDSVYHYGRVNKAWKNPGTFNSLMVIYFDDNAHVSRYFDEFPEKSRATLFDLSLKGGGIVFQRENRMYIWGMNICNKGYNNLKLVDSTIKQKLFLGEKFKRLHILCGGINKELIDE